MTTLTSEQLLPISINDAWNFFSNPANLNEITPGNMSFRILVDLPGHIFEGQIIKYKVAPLAGIPLNWVTKIINVNAPFSFTDEQISGPYKVWIHQHHFREADGGTLMRDIVQYDIGKGIAGKIAGRLFVHNRIKNIFTFRTKKLEELFGKSIK